jgi:ketosteroid isomerase-like protein
MDDQEAILGLLQSYADEFDSRNAEAFSALFADGAVLVDPGGREIAGREKFVKMVERTPKGGQHFPGESEVEVNGDEAKCKSRFRATLATGDEVGGSYEDEFVRTSEGWRFARRKIVMGG